MKKIKVTLVFAFLVAAIGLSSCEKKECHKPKDKKQDCHHDTTHDDSSASTT